MPELKNPRWEAVAQAVAFGTPGSRAYQQSYPTVRETTARANAARLLTNASVAARVAELRAERLEGALATKEWVIQQAMYEALYGTQRAASLRLLAEILGIAGTYRVEHSGPQGGPIPLLAGVANLSAAQLALIVEAGRRHEEVRN